MNEQQTEAPVREVRAPEPPTIRLNRFSDHTKVVRYQVPDKKAQGTLITDVYLSRDFAEPMPDAIILTVTAAKR